MPVYTKGDKFLVVEKFARNLVKRGCGVGTL
jgi:hypothetical protein